ncbi:hypothetical protein GIB67_023673 [Kingdonia uniflora]|uniref:Apple domain-containing protein n=1 Tax=Kingdonia uniflora TaxID=39325 RepID=A0A7J7MG81_9MAGN|nr:hypothetical protein GIB67_023673 [Kingdonia uniflora]
MKLGWDLKSGLSRSLSAWKNYDDPSRGDLTYGIINIHGYPECAMMKGSAEYYRSGPWNGFGYSGLPGFRTSPFLNLEFVNNEEEIYYMYGHKDNSVTSILILNQTIGTGGLQRVAWVEPSHSWIISKSYPEDLCDVYCFCGPYSTCDINAVPVCSCLKGFKPRSPKNWNATNWSQGCIHKSPLNCTSGDRFVKLTRVKLPDTAKTWVNHSMDLKECRAKCLKNCSCKAYTNSDISGDGSGCVMWLGDLLDIRKRNDAGRDIYIRLSASEIGTRNSVNYYNSF